MGRASNAVELILQYTVEASPTPAATSFSLRPVFLFEKRFEQRSRGRNAGEPDNDH